MSLIRRLLALGAALGASGVFAQGNSSNSSTASESESACVANATANITCPPETTTNAGSGSAVTTTNTPGNTTTGAVTTTGAAVTTTGAAGNTTTAAPVEGTYKQIESAVDVKVKLNATKFCGTYEGKTGEANQIVQAFSLNKGMIVLVYAAKSVVDGATTSDPKEMDFVVRNDLGNGGNTLMSCTATPELVLKTSKAEITTQIEKSWYTVTSCKVITAADCKAGTAPTRRQLAAPTEFNTKSKVMSYLKATEADFKKMKEHAEGQDKAAWTTAVKNAVATAATAIADDSIHGMGKGKFLKAMKGSSTTVTFTQNDITAHNSDPNIGPDKDDLTVETVETTEKKKPSTQTSTSSAPLAKALAPLALLASLLALA